MEIGSRGVQGALRRRWGGDTRRASRGNCGTKILQRTRDRADPIPGLVSRRRGQLSWRGYREAGAQDVAGPVAGGGAWSGGGLGSSGSPAGLAAEEGEGSGVWGQDVSERGAQRRAGRWAGA